MEPQIGLQGKADHQHISSCVQSILEETRSLFQRRGLADEAVRVLHALRSWSLAGVNYLNFAHLQLIQ